LRVSDTGVGIDESIKSKIFDPFFTTKEESGGVGLGLAMVYGIVKQSGGAIAVESKPGRGTSFILYFPHVPSKTEASRTKPFADEFSSVSGTILLAEDLAPLREVMAATLTAKGFRVLPARDGTDALALGRSNYRAIDLIIADIMMPGMKGPAAVRKIRELRSNIPTIFISGFADSAVLTEDVEDTDVLLEKPIAPEVLLATVYDVLRKSGRLGPAQQAWRRDSAA
jgi:two-component system cell cycle sensor histidine kinase/response regulator CckA